MRSPTGSRATPASRRETREGFGSRPADGGAGWGGTAATAPALAAVRLAAWAPRCARGAGAHRGGRDRDHRAARRAGRGAGRDGALVASPAVHGGGARPRYRRRLAAPW